MNIQFFDNPGYLLHHLSFVMDRQSDAMLQERLGIGFSQFKILKVLQKREGIQQKTIADCLGQTEASVSRQIKLLHDDGLLTTRISPHNRREHITGLTLKGLKVFDYALHLLEEFRAPVFEQLSKQQQRQLQEILGTMHEYVCQSSKLAACNIQTFANTNVK